MSTVLANSTMENQSTTVNVDPSGDIRLIAECEDPKTKNTNPREFVVSTQVMCLASPVWGAMFSPTGHWAKQHHTEEAFQMIEDEPNALLILLDIAHLNYDRIPPSISFPTLLQLSILCDKYDTVKLVRRHITEWITAVKAFKPICNPESEEWLFIAWVFGDQAIYGSLSKDLVLLCHTLSGLQVFLQGRNGVGGAYAHWSCW